MAPPCGLRGCVLLSPVCGDSEAAGPSRFQGPPETTTQAPPSLRAVSGMPAWPKDPHGQGPPPPAHRMPGVSVACHVPRLHVLCDVGRQLCLPEPRFAPPEGADPPPPPPAQEETEGRRRVGGQPESRRRLPLHLQGGGLVRAPPMPTQPSAARGRVLCAEQGTCSPRQPMRPVRSLPLCRTGAWAGGAGPLRPLPFLPLAGRSSQGGLQGTTQPGPSAGGHGGPCAQAAVPHDGPAASGGEDAAPVCPPLPAPWAQLPSFQKIPASSLILKYLFQHKLFSI